MLALRQARALLLLIVAPILTAQSPSTRSLAYLHHQSWTTEDGLPQDTVHQVLQSPDGYLWIATEAGLARFDGVSFRTFSHATDPAFVSDDISSLASAPDGSLWIGTADGLLRFDHSRFRRFAEPDGLPSASIRALASLPDNTLLILAGSTLIERRDGSFTPAPNASSGIRAIQPAGSSSEWLLNDSQAVLWSPSNLVPSPSATAISGLPSGPVWTFSGGTVQFTVGSLSRTWHAGRELPGTRILSLYVDRAGLAWVGTNDGLAMLSSSSTISTPIPALSGNSILATTQDREGNYWIGTETSGLHVLRSLKFRTEPALADRALTALLQSSDGSIWAGTRSDGLLRIRSGKVDHPAPPDKLASPVILSLAPGDHGSIWAGTPDGLDHIDSQGRVRHLISDDGLPDDYIQTLLTAPDRSLWIGTRKGLARLRQDSLLEVYTHADGLPTDLISTLFLSSANDLWIGTSGGLARRRSNGSITPETGLPSGIVTAIAEDQEASLWIATLGHGLTRYAKGTYRNVAIPGLAERIIGMSVDSQKALWIRTEHAIERVPLADLNRCADSAQPCTAPTVYGLADGLPTTEASAVGSPALALLTSGELWSATRRGVAIADPAHLPLNSIPPPVVIDRLLVDDRPIDLQSANLRIPPGHARYTMEYAALSFTAPSEVRYRVRLEGFDPSWTEAPAMRRSATYTNLPPGAYTFRVQAMNNDGVWNDQGASLRFTVVPAFYRRGWFVALAALALGVLSVSLYRFRLYRLQLRFNTVLQERNRVAREIHDTLAQDFVGVSLQLDVVSHLLRGSKIEAALDQVGRTRQLVTDGLADARRSIWELRANLSADSLPARIGKLVERYSTQPAANPMSGQASDSSLKIRLRIGGQYRKLPQTMEDEVLRIAQEALSNVHRHANASSASLDLTYGGDMLTLTVEDDGAGFLMNASPSPRGHYGVSGMQERATLIEADLKITTSPGAGTRIVLSVPIAYISETTSEKS